MSNEQCELNRDYLDTIHHLDYLWKVVQENHWENEQFVLDRLDDLNERSVRN